MRMPVRFASRRRQDITCRRAVELITDYLDNALPTWQQVRLEHHLSICPHCAEYVVQLKATIAATGRVDRDQLTPHARQTLIELYRRNRR
jgi:anti-sigma factor RsiW